MSINQKLVNAYFANHWKSGDNWAITNVSNIASKINQDETVLDIGCGYNPFKAYLGDRLYAFDPAIFYGNEQCSLENFNNSNIQWDVILCMGSINFGAEEHIAAQIKKIVSLVKKGGRIYWRQNPGKADHNNEECKTIPFFEWTQKHNYFFANKFGCSVIDYQIDNHKLDNNKIRLYAEWKKL